MKRTFGLMISMIAMLALAACGSDDTPDLPEAGDDWIDQDFALRLEQGGYIADASTVRPKDVMRLRNVDISRYGYEYQEVRSLRGIAYFSELDTFRCGGNSIHSIDLTLNTRLTYVNCEFCAVEELHVFGCKRLLSLSCQNNNISRLDISKNSKLEVLNCQHNDLEDIDVTSNANLRIMACDYNRLKSLDVSGNPKLDQLTLRFNLLEEIDISANRSLEVFYCDYNPGKDGVFTIYAWFGSNEMLLPYFTYAKWPYIDDFVIPVYVKRAG